jgi:hypothetical protein
VTLERQISISDEDWLEKYKPIMENDSVRQYETYGADLEEVRKQIQSFHRTVWTAVEGDDGDLVIVSGPHYVNRLYYVICEVAYEEGESIEVEDDFDESCMELNCE